MIIILKERNSDEEAKTGY